jgi:SseB protein N-terminal domain
MTSPPPPTEGGAAPGGAALAAAVAALLEADTPSSRAHLYQALLEASLLVPLSGLTPGDLAGRWRWLADQPLLELSVTQQPDRPITVAMFTTTEAAERWIRSAEPPTDLAALVLLTGGQAFALALHAGVTRVVIDPAGPVAGELTLIELAALGAGRLPSPADPPVPEPAARSPVAFPQPAADLPDPAKAKLVDLLAGLPAVQTAYLFQTGTSAGPARLALAVVLAPGSDQQQTDTTMTRLLRSLRAPGNPSGELPVVALGDGPLLRALHQHVPPLLDRDTASKPPA